MKKISKTREEFEQFFDEQLESKLERLNKVRKKAAKKRNKYMAITAVSVLPLFVLSLLFQSFSELFYIIGFVFVGIGFYKIWQVNKEFTGKMKQEIVKEVVTYINPEFQYSPDKFIQKKYFLDTHIFKTKPNKYRGDDFVSGYVYDEDVTTLKNKQNQEKQLHQGNPELAATNEDKVEEALQQPDMDPEEERKKMLEEIPRTKIAFSEVEASKVVRTRDKNGKTRSTEYKVFKGLFFVVDFNKDFKGVTTIVPKQSILSKFKRNHVLTKSKHLEEVELDNLTFNEKFIVQSTDEGKARYILTPAFMERVIAFINKTKNPPESGKRGHSIFKGSEKHYVPYFSFKNGRMYFLLNTDQDHFDFNMDRKIDKESIYYYFEDLNRALELVEDLDLNLRLWNKD